jgi:hypothetical protein
MSGNASNRPLGERFSHVYLRENTAPLQDSKRARRRVASVVGSMKDLDGGFASFLSGELGIDVKWGSVGVRWIETIDSFALHDFLDLFTVASRYLKTKPSRNMYNSSAQSELVQEANRIFAEENLRYEIDPAGGVHFRVTASLEISSAQHCSRSIWAAI